MARDWIKLYTCILDDADINGLSPETGWAWARMMAMAGRNEDNGRIGTVKNVAYVLHTAPDIVARAVADLDGRIVEDDDGQLWFRDWRDWQSQSDRERQRASRANRAGAEQAVQPEPVTTGHEPSRAVTDGHVSERSSSSDQTSSDQTGGAANDAPPVAAAAARPARKLYTASPPDSDLQPVKLAILAWFGVGDGTGASKPTHVNTTALARVYLAAGETAAHVQADADAWYRDDWRGRKGEPPSKVAAQDFRASRRNSHTNAPGANGHDPRFYFRPDPAAGWRLKPPALAVAELGLGPAVVDYRPDTWPPDMQAAYAGSQWCPAPNREVRS